MKPYTVYSPRSDGDIREDFYVRRGSFSAPEKHYVVRDSVKPGTHNAFWRAIWPLNLPFPVVYVDPDRPRHCGISLDEPANIWGVELPPENWDGTPGAKSHQK